MTESSRPRRAGAYRIDDTIIVHPVAFTEDGIAVDVPVLRFAANADAAKIGAALKSVLFTPPSIVPPRFWKERAALGRQFLKAASVRSWRRLQLNAVACWIVASSGVVTFTPLRNGGTRSDTKGFQPFGAADIVIEESAADQKLGAALVNALSEERIKDQFLLREGATRGFTR